MTQRFDMKDPRDLPEGLVPPPPSLQQSSPEGLFANSLRPSPTPRTSSSRTARFDRSRYLAADADRSAAVLIAGVFAVWGVVAIGAFALGSELVERVADPKTGWAPEALHNVSVVMICGALILVWWRVSSQLIEAYGKLTQRADEYRRGTSAPRQADTRESGARERV